MAMGSSLNASGIRVYRAGAASTGNAGVMTNILWDAESSAPVGLTKNGFTHSTSVNAEQIVCTATGDYRICGGVKSAGNNALSSFEVEVSVDAVARYLSTLPAGGFGLLDSNVGPGSAVISFTTRLVAGDVVRVRCASNGIGSLALVVGELNTWLEIRPL